jgi:outer membrane protein assembly factor BamB
MIVPLAAAVLIVMLFSSSARADQAPAFPSDPIWTKDVVTRPVAAAVASAAVATGERLFFAVETGITSRRLQDGEDVWTNKIVATGPLATIGDRLIVPTDGEILALDALTGSTVWTLKTVAPTAPILAHDDLVFVATAERLAAFKLADGTEVWTREKLGAIEQRPAVHETWLYVPVAEGRLLALDRVTGKTIWDTEVGIKPTPPLVTGDRVFIGSEAKQFCSLNVITGRKLWCQPIGAAVVGMPAVDKVQVYCVALNNLMYAFERRNGAKQWTADLRYRPSAGPTLIGGTITSPGKSKELPAFDTKTGKKAAALTLADELAAPPIFIPGSDTSPAYIVALSGGLNNQWKLTLAGPPPAKLPSVDVVPLTALPGQVVPRAGELIPRE